jgi:hypothetical protein
MLDQLPRYTGHICRFPCKHAYVLPQEADESVFLFGIQVGPDAGRLGLIILDQLHLLGLVRLRSGTSESLSLVLIINDTKLLMLLYQVK